jgi:branched-chain amino acid transport system permease protein
MLDLLPQFLVNGIITGALLAIPTIGFTAIFAVLRFPNFAVASTRRSAPSRAMWRTSASGCPRPLAGVRLPHRRGRGPVSDEIALKPLRRHGALTTAIASIALTIVLENIVRFFFGNGLRGYDLPLVRDIRFGDIRVNPQQLENMVLAVVIMAAVFAALKFTRMGKAMRAVADNPGLADLKGIDAVMVGRVVAFAGMGLVGVGGMLFGLGTSIDPLTGFRFILPIFAAAVVGGLGLDPRRGAGRDDRGHRRGDVGAGAGTRLQVRRGLLRHRARADLPAARASGRKGLLMLSWLFSVATFAGIYALLALGINVIWGMGGMINLGMAGFFALGAYASALATGAGALPIPAGLALAALLAALAGGLLCRLTLRLRGDYLAIVTLGFSEVVRLVAANEIWLTNGSDGISGIPGPWRAELTPFQFNMLSCAMVLVAVIVVWAMTERLRRSPWGRSPCARSATTTPRRRWPARTCGASASRPSRWGRRSSASRARSTPITPATSPPTSSAR